MSTTNGWPFQGNSFEPNWFDRRSVRSASSNVYEPSFTEVGVTEPVTLAAAKAQMRVDFTDDDTLITGLITSCRKMIERYCAISLVTKTIVCPMDLLTTIEIPWGPVRSITSFVDSGGNAIDMTGQATSILGPAPGYQRIQPLGFQFYNATLTYAAGYAAGTIDPDLVLAILNEMAFRYEDRGEAADTRKSVNPGICESARVIAESYRRAAWV